MQYFSFVGLGGVKGYSNVLYSFEDDNHFCNISKFVQVPIYEYYKEQITDVYLFVTDQSKNRYEQELNTILMNCNIHYILIEENISFDDFVKKLISEIKEEENIIIDITHSFRHIPMKLLFALRYIEISKNVTIEHLFYGKLLPFNKNGEYDEGMIIDFIRDYKMQEVSAVLKQFDKSLIVSVGDIEKIVGNDEKMKSFIRSIDQFNQMIEYCEFDRCIKVVEKIIECCRSIEKEEQKYSLIIPFIIRIRMKFNNFEKLTNNVDKKIEIINILLAHGRYQNAITFTDQFFREEIIQLLLNQEI